MINFEFETIKDHTYRLIVRDGEKILDVLQREDHRDKRTVKIGLFAFVRSRTCRLDFGNSDIDRFLFL